MNEGMNEIIHHVGDTQGKGHVVFSPNCLAPGQERDQGNVCGFSTMSCRAVAWRISQASRRTGTQETDKGAMTKSIQRPVLQLALLG